MKELLKYLVYAVVVYIILNYLPESSMCINDIILMVIIIVGVSIVFEYKLDYNEGFDAYDPLKEKNDYSGLYKGNESNPYYKLQGIKDSSTGDDDLPTRIINDNTYDGVAENKVEEMKEIVEERKENLKEARKENNTFTYGYSYLHPDYWGGLPYKRKPVCRNVKPCSVCPKQTDGYNQLLMKYN